MSGKPLRRFLLNAYACFLDFAHAKTSLPDCAFGMLENYVGFCGHRISALTNQG
jgi:hypothetical protein